MKKSTQKNYLLFFVLSFGFNSVFAQSWVNTGGSNWTFDANSSVANVGNNLNSNNSSSGVQNITATISSSDGSAASVVGGGNESLASIIVQGGGAGTAGANGPNINLNITTGASANINGAFYIGSSAGNMDSFDEKNPTYTSGPGGVYSVISNGSAATNLGSSAGQSAGPSGGNGGNISVNVSGSPITLTGSGNGFSSNLMWQPAGALINAISVGGTSIAQIPDGKPMSDALIGNGGNGGTVNVTNSSELNIGAPGTPMNGAVAGINATSRGSAGSVCCTVPSGTNDGYQITINYTTSNIGGTKSGSNGDGGSVDVNNSGNINGYGLSNIGINAVSVGGSAQINPNLTASGTPIGVGSGSGLGGSVGVTNSGAINLSNSNSFGIVAISAGDQLILPSSMPVVSNGNTAGAVNISNTGNISVGSAYAQPSTSLSGGLMALSSTGWMISPTGSSVNSAVTSGNGGATTVNNWGNISAVGNSSFGIAALSVGNSGIVNNSNSTTSNYYMGNGSSSNGTNSAGGLVTVNNSGAINVAGQGTAGIIALSSGDGGIASNASNPILSSTVNTNTKTNIQTADLVAGTVMGNNTGIYTANGGTVNVTNSGAITTGVSGGGGEASHGIVAQSIGGGGGSVLSSNAVTHVGDTGGAGGAGGGTGIMNYANITTINDGSIGALLQSIGGGGGNGGNGSGLFAAVGGQGGSGGAGGAVNFINTSNAGATAPTINTSGDYSIGVLGQSIGGGGGHGGFSKSYGIFASVGIGGQGGEGGSGGSANFTNDGSVNTSGSQSHGVLLQSVGGGGGNGGSASSYSAGLIFSTSVAVGGSGGSGGNGGEIGSSTSSVTNNGNINTIGNDSHGVILQSIGGGGGNAGSAIAKTTAVSFPGLPEIPTISFSSAVGGSGGNGGEASSVYFTNNGNIFTSGSNSSGVLLQAIGGGGGNGSDSTAGANAYGVSDFTLAGDVSVGGTGGSGGAGGLINFNTGTNANTSIITYGQNASPLLAQSIGGGGGNAGTGNASQASASTGATQVNFSIGVGGSAGDGGAGNTITINNNNLIASYGSNSSGITAQSIGGGGGIGGGAGTQGISGGYTANVAVGGSGGGGGNGQAITVNNSNSITTGALISNAGNNNLAIGGDSHGILAQSIGGGGGVGGSSDPSANLIANPAGAIDQGANAYLSINGIYQYLKTSGTPVPLNYVANVGVGGSGGSGGDGSTVNVNLVSNNGVVPTGITTIGHRSYGLLAQSIGGGGGTGGSVMNGSSAVGSSASGGIGLGPLTGLTFNAGVNVGGSGGGSGNGGAINITNSNSFIKTYGYSSSAMVAQSIGGGGGVGNEGSVAANTGFTGSAAVNSGVSGGYTLALGSATSPVGTGNGGAINIGDSTINPVTNTSTPINGAMTTYGDASVGMLLQSLGGGGGIASGGCTNSGVTNSSACLPSTSSSSFVNVGQSMDLALHANSIGGNGGSITTNDGANWTTFGQNSHGVVAQSIGGSGGMILANSQNINSITTSDIGVGKGNGGAVTLVSQAINTFGNGSYGMVAQSIGGGGGLLGDFSTTNLANSALGWNINKYNGNIATSTQTVANGGVITASMLGDINTYGQNSVGIFAQSAGGGGGLYSSANGVTTSGNAASTNAGAGANAGTGGAVNVYVGGNINNYGSGSVGVTAISQGNSYGSGNATGSPILVNLYQAGYGGNGINSETGVLVAGGEVGTSVTANTVSLNPGTYINAGTGNAVMSVNGTTNVINNGTITGGIVNYNPDVVNPLGEFINNGTYNMTGNVIVSNNSLHNYGTTNIGGYGTIREMSLQGSYKNHANGITNFDLNPITGVADKLVITKDAQGNGGTMINDGVIKINRTDLTKAPVAGTSVTLVNAAGGITSTAASNFSIVDSPAITWSSYNDGNNLVIANPTVNTKPAGITLSHRNSGLADYLQKGYNNNDAGMNNALGKIFSAQTNSAYLGALNSMNGNGNLAITQRSLANSGKVLGAPLSCPAFDQNGMGYKETDCAWGKYSDNFDRQNGENGYRVTESLFSFGGQKKIGDGLVFGQSVRFGRISTNADNYYGSGNTGDIAIALKHIDGAYTLAGSLALGVTQTNNQRYVNSGISNATLSSNSTQYTFGARVRNAYQFDFSNQTYIRPYLDLDVVYNQTPGYTENGPASAVPLSYSSSSKTNLIVSPMVEYGGKIDLDGTSYLRPYVSAGVSYLPNNTQAMQLAIVGANSGTFATNTTSPNLINKANIGLQFYNGKSTDARIEYDYQYGGGFISQGASAKFNYRF